MEAYEPDRTLKGKVRRRAVRLVHRRPAPTFTLDRPLLSISFDDAPKSSATVGADILQAHGMLGTYFVSTGMAGQDGPMGELTDQHDVVALAQAGHEIACHTSSHLDCGQADGPTADRDAAKNCDTMVAWGLPAPRTFAYPYGDVSSATKQALSSRFGLLRGLHHGTISSGTDLNQTPAVGIEGPGGEQLSMHWLDKAAASRSWLILYSHDVVDRPSPWGCTAATLTRVVQRAEQLGFDVVTVEQGLARIGAV